MDWTSVQYSLYDVSTIHTVLLNRFCTLCQQGDLGGEMHLVFECRALQDLRDRYENLFQAPQGDAMIPYMM